MSGKSELRIFDDFPPQVVTESAIFQDVYPLTALDSSSPVIDFLIQGSSEEYLDLNDTLLSLQVKVVNVDDTPLKDTDVLKPIPSNYFMKTLFSDVSMSLNDVQIEGGGSNYPYKATIESAFNFDDDTKRIHLLPAGFSSDENERAKWCAGSKVFDLVGNLRLDFLSQPKYLIPGVNVRIRLTQSSPRFCLYFTQGSKADNRDYYKVVITSAILYVRRVKVSPSVAIGHNMGLEKQNAIYPYTRTRTNSFTIATGSTSFIKENLFSTGLLPKLVVIGFVHGDAFNGSTLHEPNRFDHFNVSMVSLLRDGQMIPYKRPYRPFFGKKLFTDTYVRSILHNMQLLGTNNNNGIDMNDFYKEGYCFFTFNLTPDFDVNQPQIARDSNLRLEVRFDKALKHAINVIAYATYDANIQITKDRQVITDVHS